MAGNTNPGTGTDVLLGQSVKLTLTQQDGTPISGVPSRLIEVTRFQAKPIIDTETRWPSGTPRKRNQVTGISWQITLDSDQVGAGFMPLIKRAVSALKNHQPVPKLRLTREAATSYAGDFHETYINGTFSDAMLAHGEGNKPLTNSITIDFEDIEDS